VPFPRVVFTDLLGLGAGPDVASDPGRATLPLRGSPTVHIRPQIALLLGENGYRESCFTQYADGDWDGDTMEFSVGGLPRSSAIMHHLLRSYRAGDVAAPLSIGETISGQTGVRQQGGLIGSKGMRTSFLSPEYLGPLTKNMGYFGDSFEGRLGYDVWNPANDLTSVVKYASIHPAMDGAGNAMYVYQHGQELYDVDNPGVAFDVVVADPFGIHPPAVQNAHGRLVYHDTGDARIILNSGGTLVSRVPFTEPTTGYTVTMGAAGSGGSWSLVTHYIRIRYYDSLTGTYTAPDNRLTSCPVAHQFLPVVGTEDVTVDISLLVPATRADYWDVAIATGDSPDQYVTATGLIPIGTTSTVLTSIPTTTDTYPYLNVGGALVWRHSNWSVSGATISTIHLGRHFLADPTDTYVIFSEPDNPEHVYYDNTDPGNGPASFQGEGMLSSISSPIVALGATEHGVFVFCHDQVNVGEGTFVMDADGLQRDVRFRSITRGNIGAISPMTATVDNSIFFHSAVGPAVVSGGAVEPIDAGAVRREYSTRDRSLDLFAHVAYDSEERAVLFGIASADNPGYPDKVIPYSLSRRGYCGSHTHFHTSLTGLYYAFNSTIYGNAVISGLPYGAMGRFGWASGDGIDASDDITECLDVTGKGVSSDRIYIDTKSFAWPSNGYRGINCVLVNPEDGEYYEYHVIANKTDATYGDYVQIHTTVPGDAITGWCVYLGGVVRQVHVALPSPDTVNIDNLVVVMDDLPARYGI